MNAIIRRELDGVPERIGVHTDAKDSAAKELARARVQVVAEARKFVPREAEEAVKRTKRHSVTEFLRLGIKLREAEPALGPVVAAFRKENVSLITKMIDRQLERIRNILSEAETAGSRVETIARRLEEQLDVSESRAMLIARDQVMKINAQVNEKRFTAAGISEYIWTTVGDERVRPMHQELDGTRHSFDDPPVTNEDGDENNPGEDYQCRCQAFPIVPVLDTEDEEAA
jgi:SPP1 gp7 family putative phage head morphogenesis protein